MDYSEYLKIVNREINDAEEAIKSGEAFDFEGLHLDIEFLCNLAEDEFDGSSYCPGINKMSDELHNKIMEAYMAHFNSGSI